MSLVDWLYQLTPSPPLLLLGIAVISLVESLAVIGLIVPGVVLITAAASLAGHQQLAIPLVLLAAFLGAVAGDALSFALGYTQRERVPRLWPFSRHPEWLAHGARFFQRHGTLSVVFGRFAGPVRPVVPMVAGMMHMRPFTFAWANIGSALVWAPTYVLPGYLLGRTWKQLLALPAGSDKWIILLAVATGLAALAFSWLRHQLAKEGWLYRRLAGMALGRPWSRRLWQRLGSQPHGEIPLASLSLLVLSSTGLCLWTLAVLESHGPLVMDEQIRALMAAIGSPWLTRLAEGMAKTGDVVGILALCLPWAAWLLARRHTTTLIHLAAGLAGMAMANTLLKHLIGRARPETPAYLADSASYPSAHTSTSVLLFGLAAAFFARELTSQRRHMSYWLAILVCLPMALSRLVLDVHWASDLVGGVLLGLMGCAMVNISYHRTPHRPMNDAPWLRLALASLTLLVIRLIWLPPV
ncbi:MULTISPECIES: bifunctional DedA family/phosphatase PAP2 family protein [Halomonadaceae]|uniref:Undecaprenyl-diphosphatase n=1 Tax=Onishia taeanensis TaxID=284577 RepID=A0A328XVF2_9GAMM|nr:MULTISPECIES: bifunctional DedA family/phosphatase PAP2 family protein [Halomonas]RAR64247.1 undecaprenyl-diphosphatase [Halomonas taeanensis]